MEIKMLLGVLFIFVLSEVNRAQADDIEEDSSMKLGQYDGRILRNISKRSPQRGLWSESGSSGRGAFGSGSSGRGGSGRGGGTSERFPSGSTTLANFRSDCKSCGHMHHSKRGRVVGGDDVNPPYKYPWMARLFYTKDGQIFCSGSIISESFVLTAAHCLVKRGHNHEIFKELKTKLEFVNPKDFEVGFTTESTTDVRPGPPVQEVIPHPEFSLSHLKHDIALLRLSRPITCNQFQNPICLPPDGYELPIGTWMQLSGWGATIFEGPPSDELKQAPAKLVDFSKCVAENFPTYYKDHYYCLQNPRQQSSYSGDSGGPLFNKINLFNDHLTYVLGVASQEARFDGDEPFVFTAVPKHMKWIRKVTGLSSQKSSETKVRGR